MMQTIRIHWKPRFFFSILGILFVQIPKSRKVVFFWNERMVFLFSSLSSFESSSFLDSSGYNYPLSKNFHLLTWRSFWQWAQPALNINLMALSSPEPKKIKKLKKAAVSTGTTTFPLLTSSYHKEQVLRIKQEGYTKSKTAETTKYLTILLTFSLDITNPY